MEIKKTKITIGGLSGTGKGTVAKILASKLDFELHSVGNFFREIAKERGFSSLLEFQKTIPSFLSCASLRLYLECHGHLRILISHQEILTILCVAILHY